MKKRFAIFSFAVLLLLVASQIVWIIQVAERDKNRFQSELNILVNDLVKFQTTKQIFELYEVDPQKSQISLLRSDSVSHDDKVYGRLNEIEYNENTSLSKFIEAAMTEKLFDKNTINLKAIDTLFQKNFPYSDELSNYFFKTQKGDETIDSLLVGKSSMRLLNDTTTGVFIAIPLGTSGSYRFISDHLQKHVFRHKF